MTEPNSPPAPPTEKATSGEATQASPDAAEAVHAQAQTDAPKLDARPANPGAPELDARPANPGAPEHDPTTLPFDTSARGVSSAPKERRAKLRLPVGYLLAALVILGVSVYEGQRNARAQEVKALESAPLAKANSDLVFAEGRVVTPRGAEVTVSSEMTGLILKLHAVEQAVVQKGALLAELGTSVERAELSGARARIAEAKTELSYWETELGRTRELRARDVLPQAELDRAAHQVDSRRARIESLSAEAQILERRLAKARIYAPIGGKVITQLASEGEVIPPGGALFTIVDLATTEVEAEVGEFDIPRVRSGAPVKLLAEGFGTESWSGTIREIPDWVTSRRLKPLDPGRPSDTRVLPVKISLPPGHPLKLGQRVEVQIEASEPR